MKKFICSVLTVVLVLSLFVPASFAGEEDYSKIVYEVEKTNEEIDRLINKAIKDVEEEIRKNNQDIEKLERNISKIINSLVEDTNKIANKMIEEASKFGIKVICEYVEVEIGGQVVLIDPLRVVGF